jgi:LysM repeat protein
MNGQGGVMRLYAIIAAVLAAVTIVGLSGEVQVYAETTNNINNNSSSASGMAIKNVTVKEGDCLSTIAASNNTTYQRIFDANPQIVNPDLIYPGEVLVIPSPTEQLNNRVLPDNSIAETTPVDSVQQPVASITTPESQTTVATPAPTTTVAPTNSVTEQPAPSNNNLNVWYNLAQCESSGNWSIDTGNGFYGGLQFTLSSWQSVGGTGYPNMASPAEQIMRAELLQQQQGWGAWPVCSVELGL